MYTPLQTFIDSLDKEIQAIPTERKQLLKQIGQYCKAQEATGNCQLIFICTHNSRRSHFGQIWAHTMAAKHGYHSLSSWSGGTEATAFNPNAIQAIKEAGFNVTALSEGNNPHYQVQFDDADAGVEAWSKKFSDPANPQSNFGAIMTCKEADEACPFVPGASLRVGLSYDDPKAFDGTAQQAEKYRERCRQIAAEMWYLFNWVKHN